MEKIKSNINSTLKKRLKLGIKGKITMLAAELTDSIKIRSRLSRDWRRAQKNGESEEIQKACKERYEQQKKITAIMAAKKRGDWKKRKIEETKNDGKKFWTMIKELLGKNRKGRKKHMCMHKKETEKRSWKCQ